MSQVARAAELGFAAENLEDIGRLLEVGMGADGLLLEEVDLGAAFFDLRTGLLGELFQKLTNYRIRTAFVMPDPARHGERFTELAREHRRHNLIRFCSSQAEALAWLEAGFV